MRLGPSTARTYRRLVGQAFDFHEENFAFDRDLSWGMGQITYFNGIPIISNLDPKCAYRQPLFPSDRERSCSRRPYTRQGLNDDCAIG